MRKGFATAVVVCLALVSPRSQTTTLPEPWRSQDIGAVGQPGSATHTDGMFTVSGSGADVWGTADAFHFVYRPLAGDGTIVAEVASIVGSQAWTKMGVMIRASTSASAAHAFMLVSRGKGLAFQRRTANGASSTHTSGGAGTAPRWVKLTRAGTTITAYASIDGQAWTRVGSDTFAMPADVLVGIAAHSHDTTRLATAVFDHVVVSGAAARPGLERLRVTANGHFLQRRNSGRHFFYLADTAWGLFKRLDRADADAYLRDVAAKGFNAVQAVALWNWNSSGAHNAYGDHPLVRVNGRYDPAQALTTPGSDPNDANAYDFWDHVDYIVDRAAYYGLYVMFEPTWGYYVSGTNSYALDMSSNVFTPTNARTYGEFLGRRYGARSNVIWMLGGDRTAVYANGDFRPVWRSMAEGIGRGATGQPLLWNQPHAAWSELLMTYHATRRDDPGSSIWFHGDPWLGMNGVQDEWHSIATTIALDWRKTPAKPTFLLEPRFEGEMSTDGILFTGAYRQRYQAYHALFAGATGYAYGHTRIWNLEKTGETWQAALSAPGRVAMKHVPALLASFSDAELIDRVPDQTLIDGSVGTARTENLLIAMRGGNARFALVYSTNGRTIRVVVSKLAAGSGDAYWFNPRTGAITGPFTRVATGAGAPVAVFDPPGDPGVDNDWVLKLVVR
jgi:hypothetical protein